MAAMMGSFSLPGYSSSYPGAYNAYRGAVQGQIGSGVNLYNQTAAQAASGWAAMPGQYGALSAAVLGGLRGANRSNVQDINRKYTALSGQSSQDLINRGLGNTTIQSSVQTGIAGSRSREVTASRNAFANIIAGYQSQIGLAGLGAAQQGLLAQTQLGEAGLGFLGSIGIGAPNPGAYGSMSGMGMGGGGIPGPQLGYPMARAPGPTYGESVDYTGGGGGMGGGLGSWATGPTYTGGGGAEYPMREAVGYAGGYAPADYGMSGGGDFS
jgi:hypothetical protein